MLLSSSLYFTLSPVPYPLDPGNHDVSFFGAFLLLTTDEKSSWWTFVAWRYKRDGVKTLQIGNNSTFGVVVTVSRARIVSPHTYHLWCVYRPQTWPPVICVSPTLPPPLQTDTCFIKGSFTIYPKHPGAAKSLIYWLKCYDSAGWHTVRNIRELTATTTATATKTSPENITLFHLCYFAIISTRSTFTVQKWRTIQEPNW